MRNRSISKNETAVGRSFLKVMPFVALLVVTGLFRASQNAVQTTFAPFGNDVLRLSPSVIGLGVTLAGVVASVGNLFLVSRLRAKHLRRVALTGLAALSFSIFVIVFGSSVSTYLASAIIMGVSTGLVMPVLATLASQVPGVTRDRALVGYSVALSASLAIGPLFESLLLSATNNSLQTALLGFAPLPILAGVLMLFVSSANGAPVDDANQAASFPARVRKNAHLRLAILGLLLYQVPFVAVTTFGVLIAHFSYGASAATAQLSFTVFFVFSFSTRSILLWKPFGIHSGLLLRIAALVTLVGVLVLGAGHDLILLMIAMALLGIPHGLVYPLSISLVAHGTTSADLPKANAILSTATNAVSVTGPFLLGVITTHLGYRTMLFLVFIPVAVLTAVLFRIDPLTDGLGNRV